MKEIDLPSLSQEIQGLYEIIVRMGEINSGREYQKKKIFPCHFKPLSSEQGLARGLTIFRCPNNVYDIIKIWPQTPEIIGYELWISKSHAFIEEFVIPWNGYSSIAGLYKQRIIMVPEKEIKEEFDLPKVVAVKNQILASYATRLPKPGLYPQPTLN